MTLRLLVSHRRRSWMASASLLVFGQSLFPLGVFAEPLTTGNLPVVGSVTVDKNKWRELPGQLAKLGEKTDSPEAKFNLLAAAGEGAFLEGLYPQSRSVFQEIINLRKTEAAPYLKNKAALRLAEISLLEGKADEALQQSGPLAHDLNPYISDEALFLQARCYLQKHQWDTFETTVQQLLQQNQGFNADVAFTLMRGLAALEQNQVADALGHFKRFPDHPAAQFYLVLGLIANHDLGNAVATYQKLMKKEVAPEWIDQARLALGDAFFEGDDYATALEFVKPVTRPQAEPALRVLALHRQAALLFQQKNFVDCEKTLLTLMKEFPNHELQPQWTYLYASVPIFSTDLRDAVKDPKNPFKPGRGLAGHMRSSDVYQFKLSSRFRLMWAHLLLNNYNETRKLADQFIADYPKEALTAYAYLGKGLALYRLGEYEPAIQAYQSVLSNFPQSSAGNKAVYLTALCLRSARDLSRMASVLDDVQKRAETDSSAGHDEWQDNALYWVADAYAQRNDLVSAEKIYRNFIARAPQSPFIPYALVGLATVLSAQGPSKDAEAELFLQQAEFRAKDLKNIELQQKAELQLGKVYYNQKKFARAGTLWSRLAQTVRQGPIAAEASYREGDALSRQDFHQEAIARWTHLVQTFPKDSPWVREAWVRLGTTQGGLGHWAEAAKMFAGVKAAYVGADAQEASYQLIQAHFNAGDTAAAIKDLLDFSKTYPDDARISEAANNLLNAFQQKRIALPAEAQTQLLKLAPGGSGGAGILWEKAAALYNDKKYEPAEKLFHRIITSYPNYEYVPMAYYYVAECSLAMGQFDEAASAFQSFTLAFPKHERVPTAMFQKGVALFQKGNFDEAVNQFKAFIDKYPKDTLVREAWLNIAMAHKKAFRLDEAIESYRRVAEKFPNDPKTTSVWIQIAALQEVQGKRLDAIRSLGRVERSSSDYPEAVYRQALLLEQEHNTGKLRDVLENLIPLSDKKNEFRREGLIKLSEIYEQAQVPKAKLRQIYEEIRASSDDPQVSKAAAQRLEELKK